MPMTIRFGTWSALFVLVLVFACSTESNGGGGTGGGTGGSSGTGGAATGGTGGTGGSMTDANTGGASGSGAAGAPIEAGGGRPTELPNSDSQADIEAFLTRGGYKSAPWIAETPAPRDQSIVGSQHGSTVRVWENPPLVASLKAGRDGRDGRAFPDQWSMAVKELYDQMSGEFVGVAVAFKTTPGADFGAWTYYCYGPDNRCASQTAPKGMPIYGKGSSSPANNCGFCHGFSIFTPPP